MPYYTSGVINIPSVTGNVVITAVANLLSSITASFSQGSLVVYPNTSLDTLKQYLTVTARYSGNISQTVTDYTLSGTLSAGQSTVTVNYGGKTTTFTVNVTAPTVSSIVANFNQGNTKFYTSNQLSDLKPYLTVTANYTDGTTATVQSSDYTLSGTLSAGTRTITVSYSGKTATFTVIVTAVTVNSITANFNPGSTTFYTSNQLSDLIPYLTVTANYNDGTTGTVSSSNYTLSGTLSAGVRTITVTHSGKTATFTVSVSAVALSSITAVFNQGTTKFYPSNSLDDLRPYLTVTANYNDSSTQVVTGYSLSGTLTQGTRTITVTYNSKTDTFTVVVSAPVVLNSISASFNPGANTIYTDTPLDNLKQYLTVTASYSDSTTATIAAADYTLSGTLSVGTNTITVSYGGKTTTFTVTAEPSPSDYSTSYTSSLSGTTLTLTLNRYETQLETSVNNDTMTALVTNGSSGGDTVGSAKVGTAKAG